MPRDAEKRRQYARDYYEKNKDRKKMMTKRYYENNKDKVDAYTKSPEVIQKNKTRWMTRHYIKTGVIIKGPCSSCNTTIGVEAHHEDYNDVFNVVWYCRKCHAKHHRETAIGRIAIYNH